jgi:hypothetical protein
MPSFIGVPVAGFDGPSSDELPEEDADELVEPEDDPEPLPHAARISPLPASTASAVYRRTFEPIISYPLQRSNAGKSCNLSSAP